jgi:hypothetical protein
MTKAEDVIMFLVIFSILTIAYGATNNQPPFQSVFNEITGPFPTFQQTVDQLVGSQPKCSPTDFWCSLQNNANAGFADVAAVIAYPGVLFASVFNRFTSFGQLVSFTVGTPLSEAVVVPFVGIFMVGLFLYVGFEIVRILRGNSTAGV